MKELIYCYNATDCMRQFMASLILLGYHLFVTKYMGQEECDLGLVREILDSKLELYPKGAFFLFFKGRYELVQGNCEEATRWYIRANQAQVRPRFYILQFRGKLCTVIGDFLIKFKVIIWKVGSSASHYR